MFLAGWPPDLRRGELSKLYLYIIDIEANQRYRHRSTGRPSASIPWWRVTGCRAVYSHGAYGSGDDAGRRIEV